MAVNYEVTDNNHLDPHKIRNNPYRSIATPFIIAHS